MLRKDPEQFSVGIKAPLRGPQFTQNPLEGRAELAVEFEALLASQPRRHGLREDIGLGERAAGGIVLKLGRKPVGKLELMTGLAGSHRRLLGPAIIARRARQ